VHRYTTHKQSAVLNRRGGIARIRISPYGDFFSLWGLSYVNINSRNQKINIERSLFPFLKNRSKTGKCPPVFNGPPRVPVHNGVQSYILSLVFYRTCFTFSEALRTRERGHRGTDALNLVVNARRVRAHQDASPSLSSCAPNAVCCRRRRRPRRRPLARARPCSTRAPLAFRALEQDAAVITSVSHRKSKSVCPEAAQRRRICSVESQRVYVSRWQGKTTSERLEAARRIGLSATCYRALSLVERPRCPPNSNNALDALRSPTSTF